MNNLFLDLLDSRPYLLADGATGTTLFAMGLTAGEAPEFWNAERPDKIAELHRGFVEAGSDIILTNTFGGNRHRLSLNQAEDRVAELNQAAARIARQVADSAGRPVVVAGSMGPTGGLFEPYGLLTLEEGKAIFAEQAQALAQGGVDVLWLETLASREEVEAGVAGAAITGLPVICTMNFDTNGRTMMGLAPADLAQICGEVTPRPVVYGSNCGAGAADTVACMLNLAKAADPDQTLVAKANCSFPEFVDGAVRYHTSTPELMADYARLSRAAGAQIVGGCCGTVPRHIRAMKQALESDTPGPKPDLDTVVTQLGEISAGARAPWQGDMDPHLGRRRYSRRLRTGRRPAHRHL